MKTNLLFLAILAACLTCACSGGEGPSETTLLESRAARLSKSLADSNSAEADKPIARWNLPPELAEISGLALTPDQRLFAHNDETARITEIDYRRGTVVKHFVVAETGDFEGLTYAGDHFVLLSSNGILFEFTEGENGERVDCTTLDLRLGKECEFEAVTYDPNANALVLACKNPGDKKLNDSLVLYRYPLDGGTDAKATMQAIPLVDLKENPWKKLRPTDITVDPSTGNYVLVSAQERALLAITPAGEAVVVRPLNDRHPQAEGVAITNDHILIISDEATNTAATLTLYRWP